MTARLLSTAPISGTITERWYDATGDCTWIEFSPPDDLPWAGVFGHAGYANVSGVFPFHGDRLAFVIAGGVGRVVNISTGEQSLKTQQEGLVTAIAIDDQCLIAAADWTDIYVYNSTSMVWRSDRAAMDGVQFTSVADGVIVGRAWQISGWYEFTLETNPCRLTHGKLLSKEW